MVFSSFSRIFIFELWVMETGADSYLRWFTVVFVGGAIGKPTTSFSSAAGFLNFTVSEWDSSDDTEVLTEIKVEWSGRPISWNEFMLEKPLSSSVWWQVENLLDFVRPLAGMFVVLLVAMLGNIVWSSSSLFEFEEFDDEWTDDSSVLRNDKCDSRSKPNKKSLRCCSKDRWKVFASDVPFACDKIGSCVLRKFWTVLESLKASLDNFSASISASTTTTFCLLSNGAATISSVWKVYFSGLISTPVEVLHFGDRRLKIQFHEIFLSQQLINLLTTWSLWRHCRKCHWELLPTFAAAVVAKCSSSTNWCCS